MEKEAQRSRCDGKSLGIAMADLDHFKEINDSYGHLVGDAILKETGSPPAAAVRSYDWVGRYGGEEFLDHCGGMGCSLQPRAPRD